MKNYSNNTFEIKGISQEKYDMLLDFLEDNDINYEETETEIYTVDERTEDEKYDDWLWALGERQYEEKREEQIKVN